MPTIAKTTYTLTVLHLADEQPADLESALTAADKGSAFALETRRTTAPVPDNRVPSSLKALGDDGTFFDGYLDLPETGGSDG